MNSKYIVVIISVLMIFAIGGYFYKKDLECREVSRRVLKQCQESNSYGCMNAAISAYFQCRGN